MKSFTDRCLLLAGFLFASISSFSASAVQQGDEMLKACPAMREWYEQQRAEHDKDGGSKAVALPKLREQLLAWGKLDQEAREPLMQGSATDPAKLKATTLHMRKIDEINYRRIKDVVDEYGFPTIDMVGGDGSATAFLLVQHQANHPEFQRFVLDIMGPLAKRGEAGREGYALLLDRVLVLGQHKPQRYGTQFKQIGGTMQMNALEDPEHVDERRAEMGLMPIAAYRCVLQQAYHMPVK